uniref:ORF2 n=1 Tax=Nitrosopumilaceae spindle-shaped virus TaxID=3065433 RepID=A0AAT9J749_9VIRU
MNKLVAVLIIASISSIVFFSATSQQAYAGGRVGWNPCSYFGGLTFCHKKVVPHGVTSPPPVVCNIDKYHHCSAPIVVCFSERSILNNAGITPSIITQILHLLNC